MSSKVTFGRGLDTPWGVSRESGDSTGTFAKVLEKLNGEQVCVAWVKDPEKGRSNFDTQVSVEGKLEGHPLNQHYRVLLNDSSYTYFFAEDVYFVGQNVGKTPKVYIQ